MEKKKDEKAYKRDINRMMKQVGTYNKSFEITINTFAKLLYDYQETLVMFEKTGGNVVISHTNKNGSTNIVKNPLYQSIEKMRADIITYARELGLTPAGLKKLNQELQEEKESPLDSILEKLQWQKIKK